MANEPDGVVLAILRKIDQRTERMAEDLYDLKTRVTEEGLAGVNRRLDPWKFAWTGSRSVSNYRT